MNVRTRTTAARRPSRGFTPDAAAATPLEARRLLSASLVSVLPAALGTPIFLDDLGDLVGYFQAPNPSQQTSAGNYFIPKGGKPFPIPSFPGDVGNQVVAVNGA